MKKLRKIKRIFWLLLGGTSMGMGAVGVVLPILPTVPLLLLALFALPEALRKWRTGSVPQSCINST